MKLYDLSKVYGTNNKRGTLCNNLFFFVINFCLDNAFGFPLAMIFYRMALRLSAHESAEHRQRARRLFMKCTELLDEV